MRNFRKYEPSQNMMIQFDPEHHFPENSFERFLVRIIQELSVEKFYGTEKTKGEKPFNPKALLGIIFYGISTGNFSSHKMERGCRNDFGFMYVSGFSTPDHSTICRFIEKFQKQIKDIFIQILYLADKSGFLDYQIIATDGTKIKASASRGFTGTIADFNKKLQRLEEKISEAIEKINDSQSPVENKKLLKKTERMQNDADKISAFLQDADEIRTKKGKETKQNITDPDCRIMKSANGYKESYNAQAASDSKNGIIVAAEISTCADDSNSFLPMIEEISSNVPDKRKEKMKYVNDAGYFSTENIIKAEEKDIDTYVVNTQDKSYYTGKKRKSCSQKFSPDDYKITRTEYDIYMTCPGNRTFPKTYLEKCPDGQEKYVFQVTSPEKCKNCNCC